MESLARRLLEHTEPHADTAISAVDAKKTTTSLLFAGVTTTSASFYAAVNILAHKHEVQEHINQEILSVSGTSAVSLTHRPKMPCTHAFVLELLRYTSIVPMGVTHCVHQEATLNGFQIPADTRVYCNLWALHHEEDFWGDPYEFRPERYLDDKGCLVPADHPHRKHLMPFGAGTRVCLGESLALARLFLWVATLVQRFQVTPATGNDISAIDPRLFELEAVLRVTRYKAIFKLRA